MDLLHHLFEVNRQPILLIYGLTFLMLGVAVALQSREHSRLDFARSLPWLAAFGILHGLDEWGDLFLALQRTYLGPTAVAVLNLVQMSLLSLSFACLMEFGVSLLRPSGRARVFNYLPVVLLVVWMVYVFSFGLAEPGIALWHREGDAIARYIIGFPGALLAASGLYWQARHRLARLNVPHVVRNLEIAAWALVLYAVLAGLIPAPAPFFPGNAINTVVVEAAIGIPPSVFRSVVGLILTIAIIRALDIFDLETERFIESIEQKQILTAERERIARELHDGVIQKVYAAGLLIEAAHRQVPPEGTIGTRLARATAVLNDAIADLRRHLGDLQPAPSDCTLPEVLRSLGQDPRFESLVDLSLDLQLSEEDCIATARSEQVVAVVQEALSNVARHARARHACIKARRESDRLELIIEDDGIGLPSGLTDGYGLRNMRDRAHLLGGDIEIANAPGKGTRVWLNIPWEDKR